MTPYDRSRLYVDRDGELRTHDGGDVPSGRALANHHRLLLSTPGLVMLRRRTATDSKTRVLMAGEVIGNSTVLEVLSSVAASRWVGRLEVHGHDARRTFGVQNGVLRFAESDHPEDRLDKILFRVGVLNPARVEEVLREQKPDQRFGELLVERGILDRKQLFGYLRRQMEHTLFSAVLEREGCYSFYVQEEPPEPPATAHIPLNRLLLDAAERVDRFAAFLRLIPNLDMCPETLPGVEVAGVEARKRIVLAHGDGSRSLREIASETWLGLFETTEVVYDLILEGKVQLKPARSSPETLAESLLAPFNRSLAEIYDAVQRRGEVERVREEVRSWVAESPSGAVLDGTLLEDGLLSSDRLAATLRESSSRHQLEALQDALQELTSFALFSASLWLPRPDERTLSRRINQRLKAITV